jgi:RHS repeat-associated protein
MAAVTRGIRTKWFSDSLKKLLKAGPRLSKLICILTGHPVDVMAGEVLADALDFDLPGSIPLPFERNYYSRDTADGPMGPGWHQPLNASLDLTPHNAPNTAVDPRKAIRIRLPDGRLREHAALADGESRWDDIDRYTLARSNRGYSLTFWDGRCLWFEPIPGATVTHPLVRITDRCWNAVELRYQDGRLSEVTDSAGRVLAFSFTGGRLTQIRLKSETADSGWLELARYVYDVEGRLTGAIDPKGNAARYAYKGGVLVKETNRNGLSFHFEYDWYHPEGWCVRTWGDGGIYDRRLTYDKFKHVTTVDDSRGGRTHYEGNAAGLVEKEIDPTGREMHYEWNESCQKTAEVDGLGNRSEWAYDRWGNTILERNALGEETRRRFNELNLPTERVDAAGGVWTRGYDARGKLVRAEDPLSQATHFKHDRRGNLTAVEDPLGRTLALGYDDGGNLVEVIDWEKHPTKVERNERGQVIRQVDALAGETKITRDACGLPVTVRRPDGSTLHFAYDPEGNLVEQTDALKNATRYRYAGLNKLAEQIDPAGGVVRYTRNTEEELVAVTNEAGEAYRIELDLAGRVVKELGFDGRALELWYDRAGRCVETVNAQKKRTKLVRDALGRVVKQVIPRGPELGNPLPAGDEMVFGYDALGGMVLAKNGASEITFVRDALGRVIEEQANGQVMTSRYDAGGNRAGRTTSLGQETTYDFDCNGALLGLTFGVDPRWMDFSPESLEERGTVRTPWKLKIERDALGSEIERDLPGEVEISWYRDRVGRPQMQRVTRRGAQLLGMKYKWRSYEQLAELSDVRGALMQFQHDARSYLVSAAKSDGTVQWRSPDAVGNVYGDPQREDRAYGKGGRLERVGEVRYEHDADGQLVAKVGADGKRWGYTWDHAGQLVEVTRPDGEKVGFAYDALGRRVQKTYAGKTTLYVWDGNDLVHEVREGEALVTWEFEPGTFAPVAKVEGEKRYGVVTDHLGAPKVLLDEAGKLAWKAQLDVYGVAQIAVEKTRCPWRWPGQYEDEETGLYYNRFRYYDPESGRYVSQDPIGLNGGFALYGYAYDPIGSVDPLGLSDWPYMMRVQIQRNAEHLASVAINGKVPITAVQVETTMMEVAQLVPDGERSLIPQIHGAASALSKKLRQIVALL